MRILDHFPIGLVKNIINWLVRFAKGWGSTIVVLIIIIFIITNNFKLIYFNIVISIERMHNENLVEDINTSKARLKLSNEKLVCIKNQFERIAEDKHVEINYCR